MEKNLFPPERMIKARALIERRGGVDANLFLEALDLDWKGSEPPKRFFVGELPSIRCDADGFTEPIAARY
jgi:hypothetical protein